MKTLQERSRWLKTWYYIARKTPEKFRVSFSRSSYSFVVEEKMGSRWIPVDSSKKPTTIKEYVAENGHIMYSSSEYVKIIKKMLTW